MGAILFVLTRILVLRLKKVAVPLTPSRILGVGQNYPIARTGLSWDNKSLLACSFLDNFNILFEWLRIEFIFN